MVLRLGRTDRVWPSEARDPQTTAATAVGAVLNDVRDESEYRAYAYYMDGYALTNEPLFRPSQAASRARARARRASRRGAHHRRAQTHHRQCGSMF